MASTLEHWREAATLILATTRSNGSNIKFTPVSSVQTNSTIKGDNIDILMLKRSSKSSFMANVYVFPGGVASDADFSKEWLEILGQTGDGVKSDLLKFVVGEKTGAPMFSRSREDRFTAVPSELAFRICAIRETFEESGVLLARKISEAKEMKQSTGSPTFGSAIENLSYIGEWRKQVERNPENFITMCKELDIVPDVWSLYEWSNWLTPAAPTGGVKTKKPKRFDTVFYLCHIQERPEVAEDKGETVHSQWGTPFSILMESEKGTANIAPPQTYELSRFFHFHDLNDLARFAQSRASERVPRFLPIGFFCADAFCMLMPGDDLYPADPDLYGNNPPLSSDLTMAEVNRKYPCMHRTMWVKVGTKRQQRIICHIQMAGKHIAPYCDFSAQFGRENFASKM